MPGKTFATQVFKNEHIARNSLTITFRSGVLDTTALGKGPFGEESFGKEPLGKEPLGKEAFGKEPLCKTFKRPFRDILRNDACCNSTFPDGDEFLSLRAAA